MDFLEYYSKNLGFRYALVAVHAVEETPRGLMAAEKAQLAALRNHKRRREWLAGRLAAKTACLQQEGLRNPCVLNKASGQPFFPEAPEICLSITHSGIYAVALVCKRAVGVDLERIETRPDSFNRHFLAPREQAVLKTLPAPVRDAAVTAYWTRKEAVSKALSLGGAVPFGAIDTTADRIRLPEYSNLTFRLYSGTLGGYAISVAMEEANE